MDLEYVLITMAHVNLLTVENVAACALAGQGSTLICYDIHNNIMHKLHITLHCSLIL